MMWIISGETIIDSLNVLLCELQLLIPAVTTFREEKVRKLLKYLIINEVNT